MSDGYKIGGLVLLLGVIIYILVSMLAVIGNNAIAEIKNSAAQYNAEMAEINLERDRCIVDKRGGTEWCAAWARLNYKPQGR